MAVMKTRYGDVDAKALADLRENFVTFTVIEAIDRIDRIRCEIDTVREDLLRLHGMAHTLINGAGNPGAVCEGESIWELADELSMTMLDWPENVRTILVSLDKLMTLTPDPDDTPEA